MSQAWQACNLRNGITPCTPDHPLGASRGTRLHTQKRHIKKHTNTTPAKKKRREVTRPSTIRTVSRTQVIGEIPYSHTVLWYFSHLTAQMGKTRRLTEYITDPELQPSAKGCTESYEHVVLSPGPDKLPWATYSTLTQTATWSCLRILVS